MALTERETLDRPISEPALRAGSAEFALSRSDELAPAGVATGEEPEAGALVSACLHSLRRRWLAGTALGALFGVLAGLGAWKLQSPEYTATAMLRIDAHRAPLLFETADQAVRFNFDLYKNTQRQLLLSPFVLNNALREDEIRKLSLVQEQIDPTAWLQTELKVAFPDDAEIMTVSLTASDGAAAERIVNAVVQSYMEDVVLEEHKDRHKRLENLQRVYVEAEHKARSKRADLGTLVEALGTGDKDSLSLQQQTTIQQYALMRNELTRIQFQLMRAEAEGALGQQEPPEPGADESSADEDQAGAPAPAAPFVSELELENLLLTDREGSKLIGRIDWIEKAIAETQRRLTPAAAAGQLAKLRAELEMAQGKLSARRELLREELVSQMAVSPRKAGQNPPNFELAILRQQEKELQEEVDALQAEAKNFGRSSIDVEMMRTEIEACDELVSRIGEEIERTKIEQKSDPRITLLPGANRAQAAEPKKRVMRSAAGGFAGLIFPLCLFILLDVTKRHVDGVSTVTSRLGLDVLGVLPPVPVRTRPSSRRTRRWQEELSESVSAITAMLLQRATLEDRHVLLVSSATAGEGKTTLAGHLATALAESGSRTLLVDFDLRRPALGRVFGLESEAGVSEVLQGSVELSATVQTTSIQNLSVLPAGRFRCNILSTTVRGRMADLFAQLRSRYDFVVVDGSPILPVVDARLIGQHADGVVLSLLRDVSRVPKVSAACDILNSYGVPVIGAVVLGCHEDVYYSDYDRQPSADDVQLTSRASA